MQYGSASRRQGRVLFWRAYQSSSRAAGGCVADTKPGYTAEARKGYGALRPLGSLMAPLTRPVLRRLHPGGAQVMAEWENLVGPGLAARTTPRALERGTLTIACAGPVAMELTMLAPQVMARINAGLGRVAVTKLRFVQAKTAPPPPVKPPMTPVVLPASLLEKLDGMPEGPLREALAKLAQGVYRKTP